MLLFAHTDPQSPSPADPAHPPLRPSWLKRLVLAGESGWSRASRWFGWRKHPHDRDFAPEVYRALRHDGGINVWGRVLRVRTFRNSKLTDTGLANFIRMVRRWMTREYAGVVVRATSGGKASAAVTDEEGYFEIELPIGRDSDPDTVRVTLPGRPEKTVRRVQVATPGPRARCLVVSDIDDTIIVSHAHRFTTMIRTALFGNAVTRKVHPGAPALYQALAGEPSPQNIIAYVTSSPWNLHGLITRVFARAKLPLGPFFMTDWGLDRQKWLTTSHHEHKIGAVERLLEWIDDLPVLLIGDSGQRDTEIYLELARRHPDRVAAILIRDVGESSEQDAADAPANENGSTSVHFFRDSGEAASILERDGWINAAARRRVEAEVAAAQSQRRAS